MFISQLSLKAEVGNVLFLKQMARNQYQLHQLIWNLFAGESLRKNKDGKELADFIYRVDFPEGQIQLHVVSHRQPENRDGIWDIASKDYNLNIIAGQRLQFRLRVNPTIKPYSGLKGQSPKNNQRHDALMHAKRTLKQRLEQNEGRAPEREEIWQVMQEAAQQWMTKRESHFGCRFITEHLVMDQYKQERLGAFSKENPIRYSTVDYQGVLEVQDIDKFKKALFLGVGKSKAFGCGLMLVKPLLGA